MYPYRVAVTKQFLTGALAGMTVTDTFGVCAVKDADEAKSHVGTVRSALLSRSTTYRVVEVTVSNWDA